MDIVNIAKSFENTRFEFFGRSKKGIDCFGLVVCVFNIANNRDFDFLNYSKLPRNNHILEVIGEISTFRSFNIKDVQCGDIIAFRFGKNKIPQHLGIYVGNGEFIHADKRKGKVHIEKIESYEKNIHSIYKIGE